MGSTNAWSQCAVHDWGNTGLQELICTMKSQKKTEVYIQQANLKIFEFGTYL